METKNKGFLSADAARKLSETSYAPKNHIARSISEEAKEGKTELEYCVWGICKAQVDEIVKDLRYLGYNVTLDTENQGLLIKW